MKGATVSLALLCLLTGCATKSAWAPVEAEQGLVYGSSCRPEADRWPRTPLAHYEAKYNDPEITQAVNEHQKWEYKGQRLLFAPSTNSQAATIP